MGRLDGKVAFITGAGSGIARSAARIFTQEGAKVVIAELKPALGRETERLVRDAGGEAVFIETDVTIEESVKNAIDQTVTRYARVDILYNCAGGSIAEDTTVTEVDMSVWQHTQSLDLLGARFCAAGTGFPNSSRPVGARLSICLPSSLCGDRFHCMSTPRPKVVSLLLPRCSPGRMPRIRFAPM